LPTDFAACNAYANGIEAAQALRCPALFILGAADQMTPPKAAQALIDACPNKSALVLPATGHALMAENPEAVRQALHELARRVTALVAA
jgi:pimeloyl-ACP methyl ester carboxylesterase